jgi:hypothetical protein
MSLNFDLISNLSFVRRFHTIKEILKCVNFILTVPVFSCNQLYVREFGGSKKIMASHYPKTRFLGIQY